MTARTLKGKLVEAADLASMVAVGLLVIPVGAYYAVSAVKTAAITRFGTHEQKQARAAWLDARDDYDDRAFEDGYGTL